MKHFQIICTSTGGEVNHQREERNAGADNDGERKNRKVTCNPSTGQVSLFTALSFCSKV